MRIVALSFIVLAVLVVAFIVVPKIVDIVVNNKWRDKL